MGSLVDTGLGWYADSAYLKEQTGLIGTIASGGSVPSGYTIINGIYCDGSASDAIDTGITPASATEFEIIALFRGTLYSEAWLAGAWSGNYGGHGPGYYGGRQIVWYPGGRYYLPNTNNTWLDITGDCVSGVYKCNGGTLVGDGSRLDGNAHFSFYLFGGNWSGNYMRTDSLMVLAYAKIVSNTTSRTYVSVKRDADGAVGMYELSTGTFYIRGHEYTGAGGPAPFPSITPSVNAEFNKSTVGYSVTCMCKWRTSYGGDVYCSPVLISSQPNNTLYTRNGSTPSVNTTEHQYGGMTFYMRKAPFDTLDGSETITTSYPIVDLSGVAQTNDTIFAAIAYQSSLGVGYIPGDVDPYAGGGTSEPGGGIDTDFDITGDTILDSPLPTFSFANSGFARIYNPNLSQLQSLANYLWTDTNFLQTIVNHAKQLLEDPIESIITLNRLPISVPNGTAEVVKVLFIPTNTSMPPVTNQFVDVDCGTVQIKHEYDSALDYNPYTDISLVLPFIGVVQLDPDEVMDKTLSLTYRVDVVSGMCVAKIAVDGCVLYQYSGNCAISMPFNSADFSNYISAMVTAAKSITGVAAAGAAGAMAAAAEGTEAVKAIVAKATSGKPESTGPSLPSPSNKSTNVFKETFGKGGVGEGTLKAAKKGVTNTVGAVVSSKRTIEHAGHFSGNSGFLGVRRPYAIIKRPKMCNPEEYGRFNGRPCMMYLYLGNLSGYTEVQEIHLTGILATNDELVEIENLLKSGVIM